MAADTTNVITAPAVAAASIVSGPTSVGTAIEDGTVTWKYLYAADSGEDPKARLDWSNDGGKTWSAVLFRTLGKIGKYLWRASWHRLGAHRLWIPRIIISDPVPVRINGAYVRRDNLEV